MNGSASSLARPARVKKRDERKRYGDGKRPDEANAHEAAVTNAATLLDLFLPDAVMRNQRLGRWRHHAGRAVFHEEPVDALTPDPAAG